MSENSKKKAKKVHATVSGVSLSAKKDFAKELAIFLYEIYKKNKEKELSQSNE